MRSGVRRFSLETYQFFFSDQYSLNNLYVTLWTTAVCAIFLVIICLPIALYLRFAKGRLAAYVQGLAIFPMFVPSIILSYAIIRCARAERHGGPHRQCRGAAEDPLALSHPVGGPVIGLVWDNIPLTVLILLSGLGNVSNQSIEAARDVGAGRFAVLWHIILPRISNSILVAVSFTVLGIFSSFTLPYVLGRRRRR